MIMSKWTEVRDAFLKDLKGNTLEVTEAKKQDFVREFLEAGMPVVEQYAEKFAEAVKAQAEQETGWMKIRDSVVIPFGVHVLVYIVRQLLDKVAKAAE